MPKTIYFPTGHQRGATGPALPEPRSRSGIDITWTKTAQRLDVGGWYDGFVGIESSSLSLREFFDQLGITKKDCDRAFSELKKEKP